MRLRPFAPNKAMADFSFEVGQILRRGGTVFRIAEERGPLLVLEHSVTLERRVHDESALHLEYARGLIVPATEADEQRAFHGVVSLDAADKSLEGIPLDMLSKAQRDQVRQVLTSIFRLRQLGYDCLRPKPLLELDYKRLQASDPDMGKFELSTIYSWSLEFDKAGGDARAVVPLLNERGGRGKSRLAEVADKAITKVFVALRGPDKKAKILPHDVEDRVEKILIDEVGPERTLLVMPARATLSRRVHSEFTAYELAVRNKGQAWADREFRTWYPRDRAQRPLEVVEYDDKDSGVFLIDEEAELPYGRAYVTSGVDQFSLVPTGFSISDIPRSTWSALCAFTDTMVPKDPNAPDYALVKTGVEFAGKPGIALFDNATYNHSPEINLAAYELGPTPDWAKPFTPTEKSAVEEFNSRMNEGFFSKLDGYRGDKKTRDGLVKAVASANMTLQSFRPLLLKWAYDDYCNAPGADGYTPRQRWHDGMRFSKARYPWDIYRLKIVPTLRHSVCFRPEGILFTGLIYSNDRLLKLRRSIGARAHVEFRYDPRDMSHIYAFDPIAEQLFIVESANPEYTSGLTLYQHRLIRKMARQRGIKNPIIPELLAIREDLRTLVRQARLSTRMRERRMANRAGKIAGAEHGSKAAEKQIVTDLEFQVADIGDVEMETGDENWEVPELI